MMMLKRHRQWQSRLDALVCARLHTPFGWGTHDCCLWGADVVLAVAEVDPAAPYRGTYNTEQAARALLAEHGGIAGLATAHLGAPVLPSLARPGDLGLVQTAAAETLAVCLGTHWAAPGLAGLALLRTTHVSAAWRVGA